MFDKPTLSFIFFSFAHTEGEKEVRNMQNINTCIGCDVNDCKFNVEGKNCSLSHIHVGCGCNSEQDTCCDSFEKKN